MPRARARGRRIARNAPKWSGKSLVPDPERAPLVKRVFEDFATGRFTKQEVLARVTHHAESIEELDGQGILAFAERVLPRAADLWASLDQKRRRFLPEGIALDGNRFNRTVITAPFFKYSARGESAEERLVSQTFTNWNQMASLLRRIDGLRLAA